MADLLFLILVALLYASTHLLVWAFGRLAGGA
jgi:hypothetical protein